MRTHDFGGFSTRTCSIDIRFASYEQSKHFLETWSRPGRPNLEDLPPGPRMEMISIGTTLEHELRHYHDFLLSHASLHNYWLRLQAIVNAMPILRQMFRDSAIEYLVFPAMDWAKADNAKRSAYLSDALGNLNAFTRAWAPPVLIGAKPSRPLPHGAVPVSDEVYRQVLFILRDQIQMIENVRGGVYDPAFPFPFTPRFVSELSSLLVQCASVYQTYGVDEMDFFINRLVDDESLYARFFRGLLLLFSRGAVRTTKSLTVIRTEDVDWRALSVGATWCFCGSTENPTLLKPVDRMARLMQAAKEDYVAAFPSNLGCADLLKHLDTFLGVESTSEAARRNTRALRGFLDRGSARIAAAGEEEAHHLRPHFDLFESLLDERDRVVGRILDDPEGYLDAGAYVRALPQWPQCPVTLDFSPAGIAVPKQLLGQIGQGAIFSDTYDEAGKLIDDMAVEVSYPSFLPGGSGFPWRMAREIANQRDLFDMFFDPQQISVEREQQIRRAISEVYGKTLIRFFP